MNGRLPNMWHSELTDQVTCCSRATRASPAYSSGVRAVYQVPPIAHPAPNGSASEAAHKAGNAAETARAPGSAIKSGA